jgi:uncharacterized protein YegP (UPF0339 family)
VGQSETYRSSQGLFKGIEAAMSAAAEWEQFVFSIATNQQRYWVLKARNHKVLLTSEMYKELRSSHKGAKACQRALLSGRIVDSTGMFEHLKQVDG